MRENWFCYNIVVIKIQKRSLIEYIPEPNSIAQNWSTLITGINARLYIPALMLTDINHSGTNPDFHWCTLGGRLGGTWDKYLW